MPAALSRSTEATMALTSNGATTMASGLLRMISSMSPIWSGGASLRGMKCTTCVPSAAAPISPPTRMLRRTAFDGLRVNVAMVSAADGAAALEAAIIIAAQQTRRTCIAILLFGPGSAPLTDLAVVLLVGDVLEPFNVLAVEVFLQGDMHHVGIRAGAVPVLLAGRDPHGIARPNFPDRRAPELHPADAGNDVQGLAERVGVPGGPRARLEPHPCAADARRRRGFDDRVLPHRAGEGFRAHPARGHGAQRFDVHDCGAPVIRAD